MTYPKMVEKFQVNVELFEDLFFVFPYTLLWPEVRRCDGIAKRRNGYMECFFRRNFLWNRARRLALQLCQNCR